MGEFGKPYINIFKTLPLGAYSDLKNEHVKDLNVYTMCAFSYNSGLEIHIPKMDEGGSHISIFSL